MHIGKSPAKVWLSRRDLQAGGAGRVTKVLSACPVGADSILFFSGQSMEFDRIQILVGLTGGNGTELDLQLACLHANRSTANLKKDL